MERDGHGGLLHDLVQQIGVLLEAILDRVALGQCAADAPDNVGPDDATDDLTENADNANLETHTDDVAVADGRTRHGAPMKGGGIDVEGEARIVRRVSLVVNGRAGIIHDHVQ